MSQTSRWSGVVLALSFLSGFVRAQTTEIVSVATEGWQGNWVSGMQGCRVSGDGRFVAFVSWASNLVPGDTNGEQDIFVRNRRRGTTERVSVATNGVEGNDQSGRWGFSISADGRFVAFQSHASNLVAGDSNGTYDVFVRDLLNGTTELVSRSTSGAQGNLNSEYPSISADGRFVAFESYGSNLVPSDSNPHCDIFVRDRQLGTTERMSVATGGAEGGGGSFEPAISADGRFVAFYSWDSAIIPGDTNLHDDVLVHDRQTGRTVRVSISTGGAEGNADSYYQPSISADGRFVAFFSSASNLVPGDTNGSADVFVHDRLNGTTELVSLSTGGAQANTGAGGPSISSDGRFVAFSSSASNLVTGDTNATVDVFVRNRQLETTERVSLTAEGAQATFGGGRPSISSDGRHVAFTSGSTDLVAGDTNNETDIFVRDRVGTPYFTSLCDPGVAGVIPCPCSNSPASSGHGCENSAATGGAILTASGASLLSTDGLVFTTSGELSTATSLVLQGNALAANGVVFGQGVRCSTGTILVLYVKRASGGSITAPDIGGGDPTVSSRSAALGDPIQAGTSRWYGVAYRDPNVLGGCSPSSPWNSTQTGQVDWWW